MAKKQQIILTHGSAAPSAEVVKGLKLGEVLVQHAADAKEVALHTVNKEGDETALISFPSKEWVNAEIAKVDAGGINQTITSLGERLTAAEGEIDVEDLIKEEQSVIALTHFGYIKRMPIDTYKSQRRGGKGITGISTREEDFVKQIFTASTHDTVLFFSNKGKLYRLRGYEVPEAGRTARGTAIVNLLSLDPGEKISAVIPIQNFAEGKYLLMATKNGLIKKTALAEYNSSRKTGLQGITLKENDELIGVRLTDGQDNVVLVTRNGMCITFDEKDVRPIGRVSQGVRGIELNEGDFVIGGVDKEGRRRFPVGTEVTAYYAPEVIYMEATLDWQSQTRIDNRS
jgi:DNA gyrase/topoisomerase IV subunit A